MQKETGGVGGARTQEEGESRKGNEHTVIFSLVAFIFGRRSNGPSTVTMEERKGHACSDQGGHVRDYSCGQSFLPPL
jgi:hypothetical protein